MERPVTVNVFGTLNIAFGVMGVLGFVYSLALFLQHTPGENPVYDVLFENEGYLAFSRVLAVLSLLFSTLLLASGIGFFRLKRWAWTGAIAYGVFSIVGSVLSTVANFLYLFGPLLERAEEASGPEKYGLIGGAYGGVVGSCAGSVYPIILLVFITRPKVRSVFASAPPPLPDRS